MPLCADERFAIQTLFSDQGKFGGTVISAIDHMQRVARTDTGVGFLSTLLVPGEVLANAAVSVASKTFSSRATGQLIFFDVYVSGVDKLDLEGVALTGEWPTEFNPADLTEI